MFSLSASSVYVEYQSSHNMKTHQLLVKMLQHTKLHSLLTDWHLMAKKRNI